MPPIYHPSEITTTPAETAEGFLQQSMRQFELASPFVSRIIEAQRKLAHIGPDLENLLQAAERNQEIIEILMGALGLTEKARNAIGFEETKKLLRIHIEARKQDLLEPDIINNILYRYALNCGDQLGGVKRNDTGKQAEIKFGEYLLTRMQTKYKNLGVCYLQRKINNFMTLLGTDISVLLESGLSALQWPGRILAFNMKCPFVGSRGNNVDIILLRTPRNISTRTDVSALLREKENYILCGELKGGIDPAGADEHWKTARSALDRIAESFATQAPELVFIGAAIEESMGQEIIQRMEKGKLAGVANLCKPQQIERLVNWLVDL
ncbi:MAG: hypothetical protein J4F29_18660 [Candidatus Latescibacteria bacterium]|nr:hypothetical protein [Candidatus Latescibacterota bacterium]